MKRTLDRTVRLAGALALAAALAGCGEPTDVTLHSPGEYKGPADPLTEQSAAQRADVLAERFQLVQTDR